MLFALLAGLGVHATDYYTTSTTATLAGNVAASANWTTNSNGTTGLGSVTILAGDNLFVLSGATVTVSASTTVNNVSLQGGTATTLAMGDSASPANRVITVGGNLTGTCKRTGKTGYFLLTGTGQSLSYTDATGSASMSTSFNGNADKNGGIRITGSYTLTGPTTVTTAVDLNTSGKLYLNGQTIKAGVFNSSATAYYVGGVNSVMVMSATGASNTSNIYFDQSNVGTSNYLRKLEYSSNGSVSGFTTVKNPLVVDSLNALTNSSTGCLTVDVNSSVTIKTLYSCAAAVGAKTNGAASTMIFAPTSTLVFANETKRPIQNGSNVTINGATLTLTGLSTNPPRDTTYTLITGGVVTGSFGSLNICPFIASLSYPTNAVQLFVKGTSQTAYLTDNFDSTALRSYWSTTYGSNMALSSEHIKGGNSLKWTPAANGKLTAAGVGVPSALTYNYGANSSLFYIYNKSASNDTLIVRFYSGCTVQREGRMLLNFTGWRDYLRSLRSDYNYGNDLAAFNLDKFELEYRPQSGTGTATIYLDQITYAGVTNNSMPGPHMALDVAHFPQGDASKWAFVEGVNATPLLSWLQTPDSAVASSAQEQSDAQKIKALYTRSIPTVSSTNLTAAKNYVIGCNISRNSDSSITGRGLLFLSNVDTLVQLSQYVGYLSEAAIKNNDADAKAKMLLFVEYLLDQGLAEGGRNSIQMNNYTPCQTFPIGFLEGMSLYPSWMKTQVVKMLKWSNEYGLIYHPGTPYLPIDMDYWTTKYKFIFELAGLDSSIDNQVRDLKGISHYISGFANFTDGTRDGIKADGCGFHHGAHNIQYLYDLDAYVSNMYSLKGTVYRVTQQAYNNIALAYKAQFLQASNAKVIANASSSRWPFSAFTMTSDKFKKVVEIGGDLTGAAYEPNMASLYNYYFNTNQYPVAPVNYDGYYNFNYGQLGVQRKNNWVAVMKGMTNKLWGTETYDAANRYGRYQAYGSLEVLYNGDTTATGYPSTTSNGGGWDWNMAPGTTTVQISYTELQYKQSLDWEFQQGSFAGALSLGKNGIFAIDFAEKAGNNYAPNNLKFHKSVFTFDSLFVCLGTGIGSTNGVSNTTTNLFQAISSSANPSIYVNSTDPVSSSSYNQVVTTSAGGAWLVNGQTTGFYVPQGGGDITIGRGTQTVPVAITQTGSPTITTNYSKAYINHGTTPSGAKYQFVAVPGTTPQQMATLAGQFASGQVFTILSQNDTLHAVKYIPDSTTAFAFFNAKDSVNIAHVKSVSGKALVGVRESNDTLTVTVNNPDLNTADDPVVGFVTTQYNVSLQLTGRWTVIDNPSHVGITNLNDSLLSAGFTLKDGYSAAIKLKRINLLPTVAITAPADSAWFYKDSTINITANAVDSDGVVKTVEFFSGTNSLGVDSTAPYVYAWSGAAPGTYSITAKATDNSGGVTTSAPITVIVNASPTVSITAPVANTLVNAPAIITITANANDADGTVSKVEFFQGGNKLGETLTAPYSFEWDNVPAGTYTLTAKATDNRGAVTTSDAVSVSVNAMPTISITSPANIVNAPATISIAATAADADGSISKVEFFSGATKLGETTAAPFSFDWTNVPAGTYTITAKATDNTGAVTTSDTMTVTVNALPTVSITAPVNSAVVNAPATITIAASAADTDGTVSKVEFFQGATKLGETTTAPYSFEWDNVAAGTYSLTAKATDNNGGVTTSDVVTVIVNALPTITVTSPVSNANYTSLATVSITANASDADGSISKVEFFQGATKLGESSTAPYSFNWTNVTAGSYAITARATDNNGAATTTDAVNITVACPAVQLTIPDVYAMNSALDAKNTVYLGYGPTSLNITATPSGTPTDYTYSWSSGDQTQSIAVSQAGTYTATVTYAGGCQSTASITINTLDVRCGIDNTKVTVCHNNKTICVASDAVQAHLNHGDTLGACGVPGTSAVTNSGSQTLDNGDVIVYPNPVVNNVTISIKSLAPGATIQIFNSQGAIVRNVRFVNAKQDISLSGLTKGVYFAYIQNGKQVIRTKIVKL